MKCYPQDHDGYGRAQLSAQDKAESSSFERGKGEAVVIDISRIPPDHLKITEQ